MVSYLKNKLFEGIISYSEFMYLIDDPKLNKPDIAVISITDPDLPIPSPRRFEGFFDFIQLQFWDIEKSIGKYKPISNKQAEQVYNFILKNRYKKFLVHCMAGVSRSAGVACAIECIINYNGSNYNYKIGHSDVTKHPRYYPNWTVYDKIINKDKNDNV